MVLLLVSETLDNCSYSQPAPREGQTLGQPPSYSTTMCLYFTVCSRSSKHLKIITIYRTLHFPIFTYFVDQLYTHTPKWCPPCNKHCQYRRFHFRLIHWALITNMHLFRWDLKDSNECYFCKSSKEILLPLLCKYDLVTQLWKKIQGLSKKRIQCQEWLWYTTGDIL